MKFLVSGLKTLNRIEFDCSSSSESEIQSHIQTIQTINLQKDIDKLPKIIDQSWRITPIRKIPHIKPKPRPNGKIEQIELYDDQQNSQKDLNQEQSVQRIYQRNLEPQKQTFKKRLVKVANKCKIQGKQYSSTECSICLGSLDTKQPDEIGRLKCKHAFCFECIYENSKFSNRCPYCRSSYHHIYKDGKLVAVEQKNLEDDDPYDEPCYVCGRNDDFDHLLECEYCESAFCHTYCDNRLDSDVPPQESWYCLSCSSLLNNN